MSLFPDRLTALSRRTLDACRGAHLRATAAESCTGGLIAGLLTEISGSSDVVGRTFVTYSNEAKQEVLGVPATLLAAHGAVSAETVAAMAEGALRACGDDAQLAVAVSGVAGPGGGSAEKPVGTVFIAIAGRGETVATRHHFDGDRCAVRLKTVEAALEKLLHRAAS
ncbi:MAG: CinA family protein [Alphaproteobacteria bacterium]